MPKDQFLKLLLRTFSLCLRYVLRVIGAQVHAAFSKQNSTSDGQSYAPKMRIPVTIYDSETNIELDGEYLQYLIWKRRFWFSLYSIFNYPLSANKISRIIISSRSLLNSIVKLSYRNVNIFIYSRWKIYMQDVWGLC